MSHDSHMTLKRNKRTKMGVVILKHSNITNYHLNNSRLHLNRRGDAALAHKFIQHIRSSNC